MVGKKYVYTGVIAAVAIIGVIVFSLIYASQSEVLLAPSSSTAFYRILCAGHDHLYTTSYNEKTTAIAGGCIDQGIAGYIFSSPQSGTVPLYRLFSPGFFNHAYTIDAAERDALQAPPHDYIYEGVAGYVFSSREAQGTQPLYRAWCAAYTDNFYTFNLNEFNDKLRSGCIDEGNEGFAYPNETCIDSDNGVNSAVKGYAVRHYLASTVESRGDECAGSTTVKEYYCTMANGVQILSTNVGCPGGTQCVNGACVEIPTVCIDPDANNPAQGGYAGAIFTKTSVSLSGGSVSMASDSCASSTSVTEYSCSGTSIVSSVVPCPTTCSNGACAAIVTDTTAPIVTIVSPVAGTYTNANINVNISLNEPGNCKYSLNGGVTNITMLTLAGNKFYNATILSDGSYTLNAYCADTAGNRNDGQSVSFTVDALSLDHTPPSVFGVRPFTGIDQNVSDVVEVGANVEDANGVSSVQARITLPDASIVLLNLANAEGNKYNSSYTIPNVLGTFNVLIIANDSANNVNDSESTSFDSVDLISPSVVFVAPTPANNSVLEVSNVTINVSVTDLFGVQNCTLVFDGFEEQMTKVGTGSSVSCIATKIGLTNQLHSIVVSARDSSGNVGAAFRVINVSVSSQGRYDDNFDGNSSNFSQTSGDIITGFTLERSAYGKIVFLDPVNISRFRADPGLLVDGVNIIHRMIGVNVTGLYELADKRAEVTFRNISLNNPRIIYNSAACSSDRCSNVNYSIANKRLMMNVSKFSDYELVEGPYCGDGSCQSSEGEACDICVADCGSCSSGDDSGSGGGGGGGGSGGATHVNRCETNWTCHWSQCTYGFQRYICIDQNSCGTNTLEPAGSGGTRPCIVNCTDEDGDGYGVGSDCLGIDLNDADASITNVEPEPAPEPAPRSKTWIIIAIVVLALIAIVAIVALMVMYADDMALKKERTEKAKEIVAQYRKAGYKDEKIKQLFMLRGWTEEDVDGFMEKPKQE